MVDYRLGNNIDLIDEIEDNTINLCFTSPPYFNTSHKYQRGNGYHYSNDFEEPLYNIIDICEKLKSKLTEDGILALNLGFSYGETGVMRPFDILQRIRTKLGYFVVDNIIWVKKNPIPLRNRLTNAYEYIFILAKTPEDRKSTRLNSSHGYISYAVFCLKKKNSSNSLNTFTKALRTSLICHSVSTINQPSCPSIS